MDLTVGKISTIIKGKLTGSKDVMITGAASLENAKEGDITFIKNESLLEMAYKTDASAIIVPKNIPNFNKPIIVKKEPFLAFIKLLQLIIDQRYKQPRGIHPSAIIAKAVKKGKNISVGPNVVIEDNVVIGNNVTICPNVFIGYGTVIGEETLIYSNVSIQQHLHIGKRVIIHSGTVLGADGFGYLQKDGKHIKIPQIGTIEIGDDVEIGANVTIDRAALDKTVIGNGVKIDNHSHIAHNVTIGNNTMLIAYAKIAGGAKIGSNVLIAADVGINDHAIIGDNCVIGGGSNVYGSLKPGSVVWGSPAKPIQDEKKIQAIIKKLPEMRNAIKELSKKSK